MTPKQAINECKRLVKRTSQTWHVVYDVTYEKLYGADEAYAICNQHDLDTYYQSEEPLHTEENS